MSAICLPSLAGKRNKCTGRTRTGRQVSRQAGLPVFLNGPNEMIGQAFYSPASAIDDGFIFFFLAEHMIYSLLSASRWQVEFQEI